MILDSSNWPKCSYCGEKYNGVHESGCKDTCSDCRRMLYGPLPSRMIGGINNLAWKTDEGCNGGWSNVVRAYEDNG